MADLLQSTWKTETFVTETYKKFFCNIFHFQGNQNYNLRSDIHLASRNIITTLFVKETLSNLGAKIWLLLPEKL